MKKIEPQCKHHRLHFEAGGYHVVCTDCKYTWSAVGHCPLRLITDPTARAQNLTEQDRRLDPNKP